MFVGVTIQKTEVIHRRSAMKFLGLIKDLLMAASARKVYRVGVNSAHARQRQILRYHLQLASRCHPIVLLLPIYSRIGEIDV